MTRHFVIILFNSFSVLLLFKVVEMNFNFKYKFDFLESSENFPNQQKQLSPATTPSSSSLLLLSPPPSPNDDVLSPSSSKNGKLQVFSPSSEFNTFSPLNPSELIRMKKLKKLQKSLNLEQQQQQPSKKVMRMICNDNKLQHEEYFEKNINSNEDYQQDFRKDFQQAQMDLISNNNNNNNNDDGNVDNDSNVYIESDLDLDLENFLSPQHYQQQQNFQQSSSSSTKDNSGDENNVIDDNDHHHQQPQEYFQKNVNVENHQSDVHQQQNQQQHQQHFQPDDNSGKQNFQTNINANSENPHNRGYFPINENYQNFENFQQDLNFQSHMDSNFNREQNFQSSNNESCFQSPNTSNYQNALYFSQLFSSSPSTSSMDDAPKDYTTLKTVQHVISNNNTPDSGISNSFRIPDYSENNQRSTVQHYLTNFNPIISPMPASPPPPPSSISTSLPSSSSSLTKITKPSRFLKTLSCQYCPKIYKMPKLFEKHMNKFHALNIIRQQHQLVEKKESKHITKVEEEIDDGDKITNTNCIQQQSNLEISPPIRIPPYRDETVDNKQFIEILEKEVKAGHITPEQSNILVKVYVKCSSYAEYSNFVPSQNSGNVFKLCLNELMKTSKLKKNIIYHKSCDVILPKLIMHIIKTISKSSSISTFSHSHERNHNNLVDICTMQAHWSVFGFKQMYVPDNLIDACLPYLPDKNVLKKIILSNILEIILNDVSFLHYILKYEVTSVEWLNEIRKLIVRIMYELAESCIEFFTNNINSLPNVDYFQLNVYHIVECSKISKNCVLKIFEPENLLF